MKFSGKVTFISEVETISSASKGEMPKQTIVVTETSGQFPKSMAIDFLDDNVAALKDVVVNDIVDVQINVRSQESKTNKGQFFNQITGWRLDVTAKAVAK